MRLSIIRTNGEDIDFDRAYEVHSCGRNDESVVVYYQNELDHNAFTESEFSTEKIERIEITFGKTEVENESENN